MKIIIFILSILPTAVYAANAEADKVFITTFGAAMADSLCTDLTDATAGASGEDKRGLESLIQLCKDKGEQSKAILDAYANAQPL
ncbi:hypothetical protein ABIJ78_004600 [Salmonella enterica]